VLKNDIKTIFNASRERGWVLEPDAKRILALKGIDIPRFTTIRESKQIQSAVRNLDFPLAAKVVSSRILHKSDHGGVKTGIDNHEELADIFDRFCKMEGFEAMLVEEMVSGLELIIGAKIDEQFGPVVMLGIGGTGVEIYKDMSLRMAPLVPEDVESMIQNLKAGRLLSGYRGSSAVNLRALTRTLMRFSEFVMETVDYIASIDLNPVMCSAEKCVVVDARIMLPIAK